MMHKKLKKSIFGIFFMSMMLFLIACTPQEVIHDEPLNYKLIFDTKGGSNVPTVIYPVGAVIEPVNVIPKKEGHTFIGWEPSIPISMPEMDVVVTALWETNTYTITFDMDGGDQIDHITQPYLSTIEAIDIPTKPGYTFDRWSPSIPETMPLNGLTVKAIWIPNTYSITFDTVGGSMIAPIVGHTGDAIIAPINPTKQGHTFNGWDLEIPETMPIGGLNLQALWTVNIYTITFDTLGGTQIVPITLPYNEPVIAPNNPTKSGYNFVGWDQDIPSHMPFENIVIKALWEKIIVDYDETFSENFEALQSYKESGQNSSEYLDYDYTGQSYVLWELINARIDLGMKAGGHAITIAGYGNPYNDAGMGRIYADEIFDGIKQLEFEARLPFSPKSSYPQGPGNDKAQNVRIKVFINGILIETLQFEDDDQANKGTTFVIDNLNIIGTYSLSIEVSSGHRLTIDNIKWLTNKHGSNQVDPLTIDFEATQIDFDYYDAIHAIGDVEFMFKEVHTKTMHPDKELNFMDSNIHGNIVARFRGASNSLYSTPDAYMYNIVPFDSVSKLTFDARLFGSDTFYNYDSIINIYYKTSDMSDFELVHTFYDLNTLFTHYELDINQNQVIIKIEVSNGSVNIDNITYIP